MLETVSWSKQRRRWVIDILTSLGVSQLQTVVQLQFFVPLQKHMFILQCTTISFTMSVEFQRSFVGYIFFLTHFHVVCLLSEDPLLFLMPCIGWSTIQSCKVWQNNTTCCSLYQINEMYRKCLCVKFHSENLSVCSVVSVM